MKAFFEVVLSQMREHVDSRDSEVGHKEADRLMAQLVAVLSQEAYCQPLREQLVLKELVGDILYEYQRGMRQDWEYA